MLTSEAFLFFFVLCWHKSNASSQPSIYCPARFEKVCPMKDHSSFFEQVACVVRLYEMKKLSDFDEKCTKLAIGMYQTHNLDTSENINTVVDKFNKPSECSSIASANMWAGNITLLPPSDVDFTLVSQCSKDRLWMIGEICKSWGGDIIVAVGGLDIANGDPINSIKGCGNIHTSLSSVTTSGQRQRQVVVLPYHVGLEELYPVNKLRNHAMCGVSTSHLLYTDIDLWPSTGLYQELREAVRRYPSKFTDVHHATIVAAFQVTRTPKVCKDEVRSANMTMRACNLIEFPTSLKEVKKCLSQHACTPMDHLGNPEGHASTNFHQWYTQTQLRPLSCFRTGRYEPYLVLPSSRETPMFEEEFKGYGKNKIQHVKHLQVKGFTFSVLPNEFIIHFPHKASEARISWNDQQAGARSQQQMNNEIYDKYLKWLNMAYEGVKIQTPICLGVHEQLRYSERKGAFGGHGFKQTRTHIRPIFP